MKINRYKRHNPILFMWRSNQDYALEQLPRLKMRIIFKLCMREANTTAACLVTQFRKMMMTSSNGNIFRVTGHLTQRPVTRSFDVIYDLRLNKRSSKQSWGGWFETLSRPLWRHRNVVQVDFTLVQAPVPLTLFRSNLKFDHNLECCSSRRAQLITTKFCTRHDSVTVVTYAKFCCDRCSTF